MAHESSEDELLVRYGGLTWAALAAFGTDPSYVGDMTSAANLIDYKRSRWAARAEAIQQADSPDQVRELTDQIMAARGIQLPSRKRRVAA